MQIIIQLSTGPLTLEVQPSEKISDVTSRIEQHIGPDSERVDLLFGNQLLDRSKTIGDYDIQDQTTLEPIFEEVCLE